MKMHSIIKDPETELSFIEKFDIFICSCGYESRSTHILTEMRKKIGSSFCMGFSEFSDNSVRISNQEKFTSEGIGIQAFGGSDFMSVYHAVGGRLASLNSGAAVLIDISCMTRAWCGAIVKAINDVNFSSDSSLKVFYMYSPARYSSATDPYPPNKILGPVSGFSAYGLPDKPTSLILGLGQQPGRALGLVDHIDPSHVVLFCPIPGTDERYDLDVVRNNKDVIEQNAKDSTYNYSLYDMYSSFKMLESVVVGLRRESNIVLSSLGPKIFSLFCFLLASHYRDVSVWRATAADRQLPVDREPDGNIIKFGVIYNE